MLDINMLDCWSSSQYAGLFDARLFGLDPICWTVWARVSYDAGLFEL